MLRETRRRTPAGGARHSRIAPNESGIWPYGSMASSVLARTWCPVTGETMSRIGSEQRYTRDHPCPVCGHYATDPSGHCHGFLSAKGEWAYCTHAEGGGALLNEKCEPPALTYRRTPDGGYRPWTKEPQAQSVRVTRPEAHVTPMRDEVAHGGKTHPRPVGTRYFD